MKNSLRQLFKWGNLEIEETIDPPLVKILEDRLDMELGDGNPKNIGLEEIEFSTEMKLDKEIINRLNDILDDQDISTDSYSILNHAYGDSYIDALQLRARNFTKYPDLVAYPKDDKQVEKLIKLCNEYSIAIIPIGGATTVTEGILFSNGGIAIDLTKHMNNIIEINEKNNTVTVQAGILGPDLENKLNRSGYVGGHYPQSFEFSTVGGWVATRGAGQESTGYGKIEDIVLGINIITPQGKIEVPSYPAKAMGPDFLQVIVGSEGSIGVITEVTLKIHKQMEDRYIGVLFKSWEEGVEAVRQIMQGRFGRPYIFRLSDPEETDISLQVAEFGGWRDWILKKLGYKPGKRSLLLASASGDPDYVNTVKKRIVQVAKQYGGRDIGTAPVKYWLQDRFHTPYLRDTLMDYDIIIDTLETSTSWDNIISLWKNVRSTIKKRDNTIVMTHISHMYENGANLYFIFMSKGPKKDKINKYKEFQQEIISSIKDNGGSLSHHHGIGRLYIPWFAESIGKTEYELLKSIKNNLDPNNIMNPGVFGL